MKKCYIIPMEKCSSNCTFCISKSRDYQNKLSNKEEPFIKNVDDILITLKLRGVKNYEITGGGEPFLDQNLQDKINLIRKYIPDAYIKIYTNGNHLQKLTGLDEINISIAHYNDAQNINIMRPKTYVFLKSKLSFFKENYPNTRIRLSVPLLKNGINSNDEIKNLIETTKVYDVEYVIRTIYPHTPNYDDNYVDVNYEHPKIKYEKDNAVGDFDEIIWWDNDELYANWSLNRKKHLFSYLLLKPDAAHYLDEIFNVIEKKDLEYYVRLYKDIDKIMYLYRDKPPEIQDIIRKHLKGLSLLFGPEFLVLFLNKKTEVALEELVNIAALLKKEIRDTYSFTFRHQGYINYENTNIQANMVHAPDEPGVKFDEDIDYLNSMEYKTLGKNELVLARKNGTFKL